MGEYKRREQDNRGASVIASSHETRRPRQCRRYDGKEIRSEQSLTFMKWWRR